MKQKFVLLFILSIMFGTNQIFAQRRSKPKELIVIKFLIPNKSEYEKLELPINKILSEDNEIGAIGINECLNPQNEECRKSVYSSYELTANSVLINKNKSRIFFEIEVTDGCKTRKVFNVMRNRRAKFQLNCGVSLIAYYGVKRR